MSRIAVPGRLVSLEDAAQHYSVSVKTVRRWIAAGRIEGYRVGPRLLRVRLDSMDSAARRLVTA